MLILLGKGKGDGFKRAAEKASFYLSEPVARPFSVNTFNIFFGGDLQMAQAQLWLLMIFRSQSHF